MEGAEAQAIASAVDALCEGGQPLAGYFVLRQSGADDAL